MCSSCRRPLCKERSDGLHWFTLRFLDSRTEFEFVRSAESGLLKSVFWGGCILFASTVIRVSVFLRSADWSDPTYPQEQRNFIVTWGVLIGISLVLIGGCHKSLLTSLRPPALEIMGLLLVLALILMAVLTTGPSMARISGHDDIFGCVHDAGVILHIHGILFIAHMSPLRWHTAIFSQVFALICYALHLAVLAGPECKEISDFPIYGPTRVALWVGLAGFTTLASIGKRIVEVQARQLFIHVIREKTRRAESEFQLAQLQREKGGPGDAPPLQQRRQQPSLPDSLPTSSSANQALEGLSSDTAGALPPQLAAIAELGRAEHWLIDPGELTLTPEVILGMGGFGIVVSGMYLGLEVAVKVPRASPGTNKNHTAMRQLCNELKILRRIVHPNIVAFYGMCLDVHLADMVLVSERVTGSTLKEFTASEPHKLDRARVLWEVACALQYLHTQRPRVVHGDLKDTNVFVQRLTQDQRWGAAKLLDFGLARQMTKTARPLGGSMLWRAPEVKESGPPDTPADMFSLGRVAFLVVTGARPVMGDSQRWPTDHDASSIAGFAGKYKDIVLKCGLEDPASRPPVSEVQLAFQRNWRDCARQDPPAQGGALVADLRSSLEAVRQAGAACQLHAMDRIFRPKQPAAVT